MLHNKPPDPGNRTATSGETGSGILQNDSNIIFPEIFQRVNSRKQRLENALAVNEAWADAYERNLIAAALRKYLGKE